MLSCRLPLISGLLLAIAGCSAAPEAQTPATSDDANNEVIDINHSAVKRQSIGNCWLYATASWAESMAKYADNEKPLNMSESYWTYWHWFDQIANDWVYDNAISTGGSYNVSTEIISRYGIMMEGDFIPGEANDEMSMRQKSALEAMNLSLKSGALKDEAARRDRALVRKELDKAWGLSPEVVQTLNQVFGTSVKSTLDRSANAAGTKVKTARDIPVMIPDASTHKQKRVTLSDAIGKRGSYGDRQGPLAWREASYPREARERREFLRRVQQALHDGAPVIISWHVDFNALDGQGRFAAPPATPGRQGGHMTVIEDYQINDVPGFGTLKVAENAAPEALKAALDPRAKIEFIRVKNSWGTYRPDRAFVSPGYHDLYMKYLDGPMKHCRENAEGTSDPNRCYDDTPLNDIVLPAGY